MAESSSPCVAVLGASAGLGAALVSHHYRSGHRVIAVARRAARLDAIRNALGASENVSWQTEVGSVTDPDDLNRLMTVLRQRAPIGAVYFVAAANEIPRAGDVVARLGITESYHRLLLSSWVAIGEAVEAEGLLADGGALVAVSSIAAAVPFPGLELYGAGKAALEAWMRAGRTDDGPTRRVVVRPGRFESEFFGPREFDFNALPHALARRIATDVAAGRDEIHLGSYRDRIASRADAAVRQFCRRLVQDASPGRTD